VERVESRERERLITGVKRGPRGIKKHRRETSRSHRGAEKNHGDSLTGGVNFEGGACF